MVRNLTEQEIYLFICSDFEAAWNSLALNSASGIGRGNYMFGRQAMNLLEFASRLCAADTTGSALTNFSTELKKIEPLYFTRLPASCAMTSGFTLPHDGHANGNLLLWVLFDLMRHGLSHQYQQMIVKLTDGKLFDILLTGAEFGRHLATVRKSRPPRHLAFRYDGDGDIEFRVHPEILYLDIKDAVDKSGLMGAGLVYSHMSRPGSSSRMPAYSFDSVALDQSLVSAGHPKY